MALTPGAERFETLCEGLQAARLHHVADNIRAERATLPIGAHEIYAQQVLTGCSDQLAPIYVTPPNMHGARRCTLSGSTYARPTSCIGNSPRRMTPGTPQADANYSSKLLLRQFAEPHDLSARPSTASQAASTEAWHGAIDAHVNLRSYNRARATGQGWHVATQRKPHAVEILHCEAGQTASGASERVISDAATDVADYDLQQSSETHQATPASDEEVPMSMPAANNALHNAPVPMTPSLEQPGVRMMMKEREEEFTPPAPLRLPKLQTSNLAHRHSRRTLEMTDAARFYHDANMRAQVLLHAMPQSPKGQMSLARMRALKANASDIFKTFSAD